MPKVTPGREICDLPAVNWLSATILCKGSSLIANDTDKRHCFNTNVVVLLLHQAQMETRFLSNLLRPGDPGYEYDKQVWLQRLVTQNVAFPVLDS